MRHLRRIDSPQSKRVELGGRFYLNFSSNDYLGLANDPALKEAAIQAIERFGVGSGASRLVCGSLAPHHELDEAIAEFKNCDAALSFSSGYAAAIGTITALLGKEDVVVLDKLVHASIVDAAKLSGAKLRVFAHNDLNDLESILQWANRSRRSSASPGPGIRRVLVITESIFSMDGDRAPLRELVSLKERYGAWLMIDEAHATGVIGPNRRGVADELGLSRSVEVQLGTLGKAIGASGGFVCGCRELIDLLINRARSFIFSTAPTPAAAAAATAGIRVLQSDIGAQRQSILWNRLEELHKELGKNFAKPQSAIVPLIIGAEQRAVEVAGQLLDRGLLVPAIRFPTVARGKARLRVTLSALHSPEEVHALASTIASVLSQ